MQSLSRRSVLGFLVVGCALTAVSAVRGQTPPVSSGGSQSFTTISVVGLGDQNTMAAEFRLPIMPSNVSRGSDGLMRLKATGTRAIRSVEFSLTSPEVGASLGLDNGAAVIRVSMQDGTEVSTGTGTLGSLTVEEMDDKHISGHYEATIPRGRTAVLLRGRFQANLASARPTTRAATKP